MSQEARQQHLSKPEERILILFLGENDMIFCYATRK